MCTDQPLVAPRLLTSSSGLPLPPYLRCIPIWRAQAHYVQISSLAFRENKEKNERIGIKTGDAGRKLTYIKYWLSLLWFQVPGVARETFKKCCKSQCTQRNKGQLHWLYCTYCSRIYTAREKKVDNAHVQKCTFKLHLAIVGAWPSTSKKTHGTVPQHTADCTVCIVPHMAQV